MNSDSLGDPRVIAHLDAVTAELAERDTGDGHQPPIEHQIIEHLRAHIIEAVHTHADAPDPVAAALAELDAPSDYREAARPRDIPGTTPQRSGGDIAMIIALCGPLTGIAVGLATAPFTNGPSIGWLVHCAMQLTAIGVALSSLRQVRARIAIAVAIGMVVIPMLLST